MYRDFRVVLEADLASVSAYLVRPRDPFSLSVLLEHGHRLFPETILAKAPETERRLDQAGKALAFELPTACGFHVFRVTEAVLKRYWDHQSNGMARPSLETIGSYANELDKNRVGDKKVIELGTVLIRDGADFLLAGVA